MEAGVPITINRAGSMLTVFFADSPVTDYASAVHSDTTRYGAFFRANLLSGVMLAPSQYEAAFVSTAHTERDISETVERARHAFKQAAEMIRGLCPRTPTRDRRLWTLLGPRAPDPWLASRLCSPVGVSIDAKRNMGVQGPLGSWRVPRAAPLVGVRGQSPLLSKIAQ